jgi:penicillin-insensitive murein endopeptidase
VLAFPRALHLALVAVMAPALGACIRVPNPVFPAQSGSIGLPHEGTLRGAVPVGDTALPLARLRDNDRRWAHPSLARILLDAAHATGLRESPLVIGDIAAPTGGEISGHRSHRTGRDVDVLFYFQDLAGSPVRTPDFLVVGPDGLAWDKGHQRWLRFDDARNWAFVRAVVTNREAPIHWVFIHRALRERLLRYANAVGDQAAVIVEASERMAQPMPSGPHDDHFHVRIGCTADYAAQGCENGWTARTKPISLAGVRIPPGDLRAAILSLAEP